MSRTVTAIIKTKVRMQIDEGTEVSEVIQEMDYSFQDTTGKADFHETEILDHEIIDSK